MAVGAAYGYQPNGAVQATASDDIEYPDGSLSTNNTPLAQSYAYRALQVGPPASDLANGRYVIDMLGRSVLEMVFFGTGSAGDTGRAHIFGWKPI